MSTSDVIAVERLEALLRGDPPLTADERRRAAVVGALRGGSLHAPEALRARVLATAPAERRLRRPSRRLPLVALPAALGLALAAAVVHGVVGSGTSPTVVRRATPAPTVFQGKAVGAETGAASGAAGTAATPAVGDASRLQHTDASLAVQVANAAALSEATTKATRIVGALGGWAQSVTYSSARGGGGSAHLDLRVPGESVRTAVAQLGGLGTLLSQQLSVQDLQQRLKAQSDRIDQLRRRVAALEQAVNDPALPDAQRVLLRIQLAEARRLLAQTTSARTGTLAAGVTANISLDITTRPSAAAVVHPRGRLGRIVHSAAGFLALEGTIALYVLIVLLPPVALVILVWALLRVRRRRDEQRLLAG